MDANFNRYPGRNYRANFNTLFHTIVLQARIKYARTQYLCRTLASA
jgi:hypothetical protein